jgi:hypothetical protein
MLTRRHRGALPLVTGSKALSLGSNQCRSDDVITVAFRSGSHRTHESDTVRFEFVLILKINEAPTLQFYWMVEDRRQCAMAVLWRKRDTRYTPSPLIRTTAPTFFFWRKFAECSSARDCGDLAALARWKYIFAVLPKCQAPLLPRRPRSLHRGIMPARAQMLPPPMNTDNCHKPI